MVNNSIWSMNPILWLYYKNMEPKEPRHYVKLFRNIYNIDIAIKLLNEGYTYRFVAEKLGCDRSSVVSFRQRQEGLGVVFKEFKVRNPGAQERFEPIPQFVRKPVVERFPPEKLNPGKDSYKDYLEIGKLQIREAEEERMRKARETIAEVRAMRIRDGIKDEPVGAVWGWL